MGDTFSALFLCLAMSGTIHCYWQYEKPQTELMNEQEIDFAKERVGRQLASAQSTYQYVYNTDITVEGYDGALARAFLTNPAILPYTVTISSSVSITIMQASVTTECNVIDAGKTCTCTGGYKWNLTACYSYAPCSNSSSFCSCLLVLDSNSPYCVIPQNTSDNKVHINGSLTMNETFTGDLLDRTTVKYKALESNISLTLLNAYTKNCNPLNVSVLGFSPGSVVANYRMALAGPLSAMQLSSSNALAAQSLRTIVSSQLSTTGLASVEPAHLEVKIWDPIRLICLINETVTAVNWSLITNNITNMIFSGGGNVVVSKEQLSDKTVSILYVNNSDQWWEGTYVCEFYNDSLIHRAEAQVDVILLPSEIIADPMQKSLTMVDTAQLLLQCCVPFDGEEYNVTWTYGSITQGAQPGNRTDLKCFTLVPPLPANDTNYTCTFTNKAGQLKETSIPVTVIGVEDKYCSINESYGVTWNVSKAGVSATASCPLGKSGYMARDCSTDGVWLPVQDNCINAILQAALNSVQELENGLGIPQSQVPLVIQKILPTNGTFINNTAEISALVSILGTISKVTAAGTNTFDVGVVTSFLAVASDLTDPSRSSLWQSSSSPPASKLLQMVEQFSQRLQVDNGSFEIDLENIHLKGNTYERGSAGQNYEQTFDKYLGVGLSINQQAISSLLQGNDVKITTVVFSSIGDLLPSKTEKRNDSQLNSLVQSTSIRLSDGSSASSSILMSFKINNSDERYSQQCVFWDFSGGLWSDVGCTSRVVTNTTYCSCNHLTSFAVLMSIDSEFLPIIEELTNAGLAVSIISLCLCIFIEWFVWKSVVRTNISYFRHTSLVNIAVSLLCADACFLSSAFPSVISQKLICHSITFLNHFFYLSLFFWTFAQSMMLLHQLLFLFHHLRKKVFISLSFFVGYFIPIIIATGTFLYFYPRGRYSHANVCWLNPESGAIYAFAIPAGSIIVFNLCTLLVVIAKLSRPSVSDASLPDDRETAKSILKAVLVLTPVFGLTWSFGFALLTDLDHLTKQVFTYGFAGMNAFQGFFILLTCITERKESQYFLVDSPIYFIYSSSSHWRDLHKSRPVILSVAALCQPLPYVSHVRDVLFCKSSSKTTSTTTMTSEVTSKTTSSIKKQK